MMQKIYEALLLQLRLITYNYVLINNSSYFLRIDLFSFLRFVFTYSSEMMLNIYEHCSYNIVKVIINISSYFRIIDLFSFYVLSGIRLLLYMTCYDNIHLPQIFHYHCSRIYLGVNVISIQTKWYSLLVFILQR